MRCAGLNDLVRTVRFRLMFWTSVVVVVLVGVTLLAVRLVAQRILVNEFEQVLLGDVEEVSLEVQQKYPQPQLFQMLDQKTRVRSQLGWFVQIYKKEGTLVYQSQLAPDLGPLPPLTGLTDNAPRILDRSSYCVVLASCTAAEVALVIRLGSSRQSVEDDIALLNRIMLMAGISILLLAPLGGYIFAGRVTKPLAWIIATTARLQPQKLAERLPLRGTGDELDQLSQTINGMLDRIATYIDRNRDFIAHAAHELRSPLAAICTSVEVALNRPRTHVEYASLMIDVMEECGRLSHLVNRLLLLAEGDAGRLGPREQTTRLDHIIRESLDMFQPVAEAQGLRLELNDLKDLPPAQVPGEDIHIRQIVRNLIDNAITFTAAPGAVNVSLTVDPQNHRAVLKVADTGMGIAPEMLPRIFDRFYRGAQARGREGKRAGYGLGLSICQSIVQALHGDIVVKSQPGHGSTFTVSLPLTDDC